VNDRVYVELNFYTTKLFIPNYQEETLIEIKRFYNTVSYGNFASFDINHHPDEPIYANHAYQSVFDVSKGFLGRLISIEEISDWYVDIILEDVKEFKKIFLLIDFDQDFIDDNRLNLIRSKLISKKTSSDGKRDILLWDLKKIQNQIEFIKMISLPNKSDLSNLIFANNSLIKFMDETIEMDLTEKEGDEIIGRLNLYSKPSWVGAISAKQIQAMEHDIHNSQFQNLEYSFQDYNFNLSETIEKDFKYYLEKKINNFLSLVEPLIKEQIGLFWIGQNNIVLNALKHSLKPSEIYNHEVLLKDKFYFFHNMEEFNKNQLRKKDFNDYFLKNNKFNRNDMEITFDAIHNLSNASTALRDKSKQRFPLIQLIESRIELSDYRIGKKVIYKL
jgi:hypothetical protein